MYHYTAYGLGVKSEVELPGLLPASDGHADITIRREHRLSPPAQPALTGITFRATAEEVYYSWDVAGQCSVRRGTEILFAPDPGDTPEVLAHFLTGLALATAMQQRGYLPLHASSVSIRGAAVLFAGDSGTGKSTTAAALHGAGYPVAADDITVIDAAGEALVVLPAHPLLKLWPDSLAALGQEPTGVPKLVPEADKRSRRLEAGFCREPLPLRCIYVLAPEPDRVPDARTLEINPLAGGEAFLALLKNTFCARQLPAAGQEQHFQQCSRVAAMVPVRKLVRRGTEFALDELIAVVTRDLGLD